MSAHFEYHAPATWDEAVTLLAEYGPDARPLAGGTDLLIQLERGQIAPHHVVSLVACRDGTRWPSTARCSWARAPPIARWKRTPALLTRHTALVDASRQIGGVQVRNVATVAGNLCNASPAADAVLPLLAMDAILTLRGPDGERSVPGGGVHHRPAPDRPGLVSCYARYHRPVSAGQHGTVFLKAGRRRAMEISMVAVAVRLTFASGRRRCLTARIALGAVAPTPCVRARPNTCCKGSPSRPTCPRGGGECRPGDRRPFRMCAPPRTTAAT